MSIVLLLHPTHRKFIKLLQKQTENNGCICFSQNEINEYKKIFSSTTKSIERHQRIYRIFLKAIQRTQAQQCNCAIILTSESVNEIEKNLRKVELRDPLITFRNSIIYPIITSVLRYILKRLQHH